MNRETPNWTSRDMTRIQKGLERIASLGTNAGGGLAYENLRECEAIARDLLNQKHGVWRWGVGKSEGYKSPYVASSV